MASNLLLLETTQHLVGVGYPRYEKEWGNLYLDTFSYARHIILEDEDLPWTKIDVGGHQSLHQLGIPREGVNLLGFEFNSGDYKYWKSSTQFIEDLRWVRDKKQVDLSGLSPLGYLIQDQNSPWKSYRLEQKENGLILEKIVEAQRK